MARIQGIQIEIGGNTQGLTQALRRVDNDAKTTQEELMQVERALKFDPGNTTLIAQQQQLLADSIQNASTRLDGLRNAQERVQQQFDSGDIDIEQYRLFQRELANSESSLRGLQGRLDATTSTQERFADAQQQLQTYLQATDQSVDDLASTLGSRLTNSIRDGSASADQLEAAIRRISQTSGNTIQDLERFQDVLRNSGNNNLDEVRRDLQRIGEAANEAEGDVSGLNSSLGGLAAGAGAALGTGAAFGLVEELTEANIAFAQLEVQANRFNVELEGVQAGRNALASVRADVNQITETFGNLLQAGFQTSDSLNRISESLAGARIRYGETFSPEGLAESITTTTQLGEVTGQLTDLLEKEGINVDTFNARISGIADVSERANFVAQLLADQGLNATFQEYQKLNPELAANSASVNENEQALADLATSLTDLVVQVRDFITSIVEWVNANQGLAATLVTVGAGLGLLVATFALLFPAIGGLVTAWPVLTSLIAGISTPILIVIAAIVALGAAFVVLYKESEDFRNGVNQVFEKIRDVAIQVFEAIAEFIGQQIQKIKDFWETDGQQVLEAAQNIFGGIQAVVEFVMPAILAVVEFVWESIKSVISGAIDVILGVVQVFAGIFTGDFDKIWEGVKTIFSGGIALILGLLNLSFVGGIRKAVVNLAKKFASGIKGLIDDAVKKFNELKTKVLGTFEGFSLNQIGKDLVNGLINGIKSVAGNAVAAARKVGEDVIEIFKNVFKTRSPSRITMGIGDDVGTGLAIGISNTGKLNERAVNDVGQVILRATEANAKAVMDIDAKNEAERDKLRKAANEKIIKLQRDSNVKTAKQRSDQAIKINDIEKKLREDLASTNDKFYKQIIEQESNLNAERLKAVQDNLKARKDANDISLIDEADYLRAAYQQFKDGSAENLTLQASYRDSVKAINDSITKINDDNLKETQRINDNLIKGEEDLNKRYEDALNARATSLRNSYSLFEGVGDIGVADGQQLLDNIQSQVNSLEEFNLIIRDLRGRGVSDALLEDLQNSGPKALEQLRGLTKLTDDELIKYQGVYEYRSKLSREIATRELEPLRDDTQKQIQALRETANNELTQLNVTWQQQINRVVTGTNTQLSTLRQVGINAGQSLLDGLTNVQSSLLNKAKEIADGINKTLADTLRVELPSTVNKDFDLKANGNLNSNISSSTQRLNNALSNASSSISSSAGKSLRNTSVNQQNITNQNNINMAPVIEAINKLANTPVQPQLVVDGRNLTQVVSQYQRQDATLQGLSRGVQFT